MNIYNWKGYDFVGTAADFAGIHCKCKAKTYTNSVKYVTRHRYNNMDGREQKAYDDKRKRAKRAYCIYTDDNAESGYLVSKKDFEAADLPEVVKKYEPIFLTYRDVYIPLNFIGESRVENPVPSAMLLFRKIAERFSMQSMFALGYFNTRDNEENPDVCLSHTTIYLKYPCGIIFQFDSCMCDDGVDNCRLTLIRKGENDIYNCFRDGRILTVHGIEMVCRPNPDCRRADYFFHMKQFQDRLKNYGYNIILFGNMVSRRSYWPPKAPSPTQTKERMVEASLRCLRLRGASSQERQMSQTVYSTPVICNTIFMAYIKQFKNRTRQTEEIKNAADELYKGSEYPVPNIYCFMKGAEWADQHPLPAWRKFEEQRPENEVPIIVAVIHPDFKIASYELMIFNPLKCFPTGKGVFWMPIPDIPDNLMKSLFGLSDNE